MSYYGTVAGGDAYFLTVLSGNDWEAASGGDKLKALGSATQLIETLNFTGDPTDEDQELSFPRDPDTTVPEAVEKATYELANALLSGVDVDLEVRSLTNQSDTFGPSGSARVANAVPDHVAAGIPSLVAWRLLRPYLRSARVIKLHRTM